MTVALYCRLSPRPDGAYEGVDRQEEWGRTYASGVWPGEPIEVFADSGISAANGDHRPGYAALRDAITRGEIAHVWCVEQSRLERQEIGWFVLAAELADAGISELHTNRDGIVRVGDDAAGIKAVLNAGEVRRLRRRVNDALDQIAAEGRPGGAHPYGYRNARNERGEAVLEVVPEQAEVIEWAAGRILAGWSLNAVAAELAARGVSTRHGGRWSHKNVRKMLVAPTVAGFRVHRGEVVRRGTWKPILDEVTWRQLVARLDNPKHHPARHYLLSGLAECGRCGAKLSGRLLHGHGRTTPTYWCSAQRGGCARLSIVAERVEEYVVSEFMTLLDGPNFHAIMASDDFEPRRTELAAELEAVEAQHVELAKRWASGEVPAVAWDAARADLDERKQRAQDELAAVPAPMVDIDPTTLRRAWKDMTLNEKRTALGILIERVVITPARPGARVVDLGRISIEWRMVRCAWS
jgi:site-specific DNA recombinase